ncbi:MAG TPA: hypothetical protein DEB06_09720, partial [Phycisphaerales bacterium]|nr:hypothetical protein [Phycisphaerales bacterium]
ASDGVAGLEAIARHRPDCVVISLTAPAQDAPSFLKALRGQSAPPVIVLAQCPRRETVESCTRLGAAAVVERSFDGAATIEAIASALARSANGARAAA